MFNKQKEIKKIFTPFRKIQPPHSLEVFLMNFFYHHVKKKVQYDLVQMDLSSNKKLFNKDNGSCVNVILDI